MNTRRRRRESTPGDPSKPRRRNRAPALTVIPAVDAAKQAPLTGDSALSRPLLRPSRRPRRCPTRSAKLPGRCFSFASADQDVATWCVAPLRHFVASRRALRRPWRVCFWPGFLPYGRSPVLGSFVTHPWRVRFSLALAGGFGAPWGALRIGGASSAQRRRYASVRAVAATRSWRSRDAETRPPAKPRPEPADPTRRETFGSGRGRRTSTGAAPLPPSPAPRCRPEPATPARASSRVHPGGEPQAKRPRAPPAQSRRTDNATPAPGRQARPAPRTHTPRPRHAGSREAPATGRADITQTPRPHTAGTGSASDRPANTTPARRPHAADTGPKARAASRTPAGRPQAAGTGSASDRRASTSQDNRQHDAGTGEPPGEPVGCRSGGWPRRGPRGSAATSAPPRRAAGGAPRPRGPTRRGGLRRPSEAREQPNGPPPGHGYRPAQAATAAAALPRDPGWRRGLGALWGVRYRVRSHVR